MAAIRVPRLRLGHPRSRSAHVIGGKGYRSGALRSWLRSRGIAHTIPERADQIGCRARRGSRAGDRPAATTPQPRPGVRHITHSHCSRAAAHAARAWHCGDRQALGRGGSCTLPSDELVGRRARSCRACRSLGRRTARPTSRRPHPRAIRGRQRPPGARCTNPAPVTRLTTARRHAKPEWIKVRCETRRYETGVVPSPTKGTRRRP